MNAWMFFFLFFYRMRFSQLLLKHYISLGLNLKDLELYPVCVLSKCRKHSKFATEII